MACLKVLVAVRVSHYIGHLFSNGSQILSEADSACLAWMERPGKKSRGLNPPFGPRCRLFNIGPQAGLFFLRVGLVYWGLTPQQQAGLYRNGDNDDGDDGDDDDDDEMSVFACRPKLEAPFKNPVSASQIIPYKRILKFSLYSRYIMVLSTCWRKGNVLPGSEDCADFPKLTKSQK